MTLSPDSAHHERIASESPLFASLPGDIDVSFEFFPPKTEKMNEQLWACDRDADAARSALRFGDLWRGRIDPRTHPRHSRAHPARDAAQCRRPSHLRRSDQGGDRRGCERLLECRRAPHRRAARRSTRSWQGLCRPSRWLRKRCRAGCGAARASPVRDFGRGLSRMPPRFAQRRGRSRQPQAQDRCGREPRDHPVLFRARDVFPVPRRGCRCRDPCRDRAGHHAGDELCRRRPHVGNVRHNGARLDGDHVRGPRRHARRTPARLRHSGSKAVPQALHGRRAPVPFLHAQPGGARLCDLPPARRETQGVRPDERRSRIPRPRRRARADLRWRLWHLDPEVWPSGSRLSRRSRPAARPEGQQRPALPDPAAK